MTRAHGRAAVLCIGGLDPSGGAGLAADIATVAAHGLHPAAVATCLTAQGRTQAQASDPVDVALIRQQLEAVLADTPIAAVKVGALPTAAHAQVLLPFLERLAVPLVVDPVLTASAGLTLGGLPALEELLPRATAVTPNQDEFEQLQRAGLVDAARLWLVTGADADSRDVHNRLTGRLERDWQWPRLPGRYRGSGCTLASALACQLALGAEPATACEQAQAFTWACLRDGWRFEDGVHLPLRSGTGASC